MKHVVIPFPAPTPIPATAPPGRVDGGACPPGSPEPFPAELVALATYRAAELRMMSAFSGLSDLIEKAKDNIGNQHFAGIRAVGHAMIDSLLDLREALETVIAAEARKVAVEEAVELDRTFKDMAADVAEAEWRHLRPDQRQALLWAQVKALSDRISLVMAGDDGEPPEAA